MPVSFPPLAGEDPVILILGSMPGAESLRLGQYYAHPQNRFWKIMFRYFNAPFSADYEIRKSLLTLNRVALWDSVKSCERENSSLDAKIKQAEPNGIDVFLAAHPSVKAVLTNGKTSSGMFIKNFSGVLNTVAHRMLPSTSPANAQINFERLYGEWAGALDVYLIK